MWKPPIESTVKHDELNTGDHILVLCLYVARSNPTKLTLTLIYL